jgi:hypothetical protein
MNAVYYILVIVLFVIALAVMYGFALLRDKGGRKTLAKKGLDLGQLEKELASPEQAVTESIEMSKV